MFNEDISKIERIHLNLFDLKPKQALIDTYKFYKDELSKYFSSDGQPLEKYFETVHCPICSHNETTTKSIIDHFAYDQCQHCHSIYNKTMLKNEILEEMYKSGIYLEYFKNLVVKSQKLRKETLERRKVRQLSSFFKKPGRILDVGCGSGSLLKECQDIGWDVYGVDPSNEAIKIAKEKYNLDLYQGTFEDYNDTEKFDCIVFIGIEHLQNPMAGLEKASSLLNEDGIIFFEAPSADSFLMNYVSKFPFGATRYIESARHYLFFSQKSINYICEKFNLDLAFIESNGLDVQTILLEEFDEKINEKLLNMQDTINGMLLGDHYRVFLRKRSQ